MGRAGFRPLRQGRQRGVVQGDSLRTPVSPLEGIDALESLLPGARDAFEILPHAVRPFLVPITCSRSCSRFEVGPCSAVSPILNEQAAL
jgi:hypothetical protein